MTRHTASNVYKGTGLAVLATMIWSGNFIVARAVFQNIPPVSLNFFRWGLATLIIFPFAIKAFKAEWPIIRRSWHYLFWISLFGISLFNTFVYVGAHYTSAINLALIGTTSSPVMSVLFARIFLKEHVGWLRVGGMALCLAGVLYLLSRGDWGNLRTLQFGTGDLWVLLAAFCFAVYNTMVRKKPSGISPVPFLFTIFLLGTVLVLPFFLREIRNVPAIHWSGQSIFAVVYLGLGASVICFWIWNIAIGWLGAGRTALFGNLIPVFSSIGAVILLQERITPVHLISFGLVVTGLVIANLKK
ncbi:MAG: DMT family transporter [Chitinophagaceae bacterium]